MSIADVLSGAARYTLIEGDCRDVLPTLADKSVAHVITDPPYEAEAHTKQRRVKRAGGVMAIEALSFEAVSQASRAEYAGEISRLAKRWAIAFCQVEGAVEWQREMTASGAMSPRRIGVWIKPDGMPQFSGDRPGMGYESIVFTHAKGASKWSGGGRVGVFVHNKNTPGGAHEHETQKPVPLMLELVELFTDPDDIILDPFAGSGTTGVAALRLGRRFIGIERDAKYAAVARERLAAEAAGSTLQAARAGQTTLFGGTK